jgi:single-strand DNA-binding protein
LRIVRIFNHHLNYIQMSVNKAILVGNVGKDPDVRHLDGGTSVARFTLATSESYKNKAGELVKNTEWHNIVAWRQLAELSEKYVRKGNMIYVEGKITNRQYDDKEGVKRYISEIVADTIQFLGKKDDSGSAPSSNTISRPTNDPAVPQPDEHDQLASGDDLPF